MAIAKYDMNAPDGHSRQTVRQAGQSDTYAIRQTYRQADHITDRMDRKANIGLNQAELSSRAMERYRR